MTNDEYVIERNKLIPTAVAYADEMVGEIPAAAGGLRTKKIAEWNGIFIRKMDELWRGA